MAVARLLLATLGVAAVVLGEGDDAPGLQLLGALLVAVAVTTGLRSGGRARWPRR